MKKSKIQLGTVGLVVSALFGILFWLCVPVREQTTEVTVGQNKHERRRRTRVDRFVEQLAASKQLTEAPQSNLFATLKDFRELSAKVLLIPDEQFELQKQMSDVNLVRKSFLSLIEAREDLDALPENQMLRMMALDFLEAALRWQENPIREQVKDSLRHAMLYDNLSNVSDLEIRKSYAGDKIEAYAILKAHSPESLKILEGLPEDGKIRKIITYAEKLTLRK